MKLDVFNHIFPMAYFEKMQERLPNAANMLLLVRSNGTIRFFTHAAKPEPRAGDTILSFSPPQTKTAEEMAAKKASKKQGPQPT